MTRTFAAGTPAPARGVERRGDLDVGAGRRVLDDVVEQVAEHLRHQAAVDVDGGQLRRATAVPPGNRPAAARAGATRPPPAHQRLPVLSQADLAGFEAHQVQHVRDQLGHLPCLGLDGARQRRPCRRIEGVAVFGQGAARAGHHRQRRAQVRGDGGQQGVAQALPFGRNPGLSACSASSARSSARPVWPAKVSTGDAARAASPAAGSRAGPPAPQVAGVASPSGTYSAAAAARVSVPRPAWPAVVGHPLRHGQVGAPQGGFPGRIGGEVQPAGGIRQQDDRLAAEHLGDVADRDPTHVGGAAGGGELTAHRIQQRRAPFARTGDPGLLAYARHQRGDDQRDQQHHRKGDQVLGVGDREVVPRRHENSRTRRRSAPR